MRIQHNLAALNAYRQLGNNNSALSKNLEKLSSGYRINRAGDDAAGLAISEKMRAQIRGLEAAQKNANDGISLVQTAEGALTEVHSMLNRMTYLATQSANGTYDNDVDRANLQAEVDSLLEEIDRISQSTNFNGLNLLDGSMDAEFTKATGGKSDVPILQNVAKDPTAEVGNATVLKEKALPAGATVINVELHNTTVTGKDGDTVSLQIGDETISFTLKDTVTATDGSEVATGTALTGKALADAFKSAFEGAGGEIGGQAFTVTTDANGKMTFTQATAPTHSGEVVDANVPVTVTHTPNPVTAKTYTTKISATDAAKLTTSEKISIGGTEVTLADDFATQFADVQEVGNLKVQYNATKGILTITDPTGTAAKPAVSYGAKAGDNVAGANAQAGTAATAAEATITMTQTGDLVTFGGVTLNHGAGADSAQEVTVDGIKYNVNYESASETVTITAVDAGETGKTPAYTATVGATTTNGNVADGTDATAGTMDFVFTGAGEWTEGQFAFDGEVIDFDTDIENSLADLLANGSANYTYEYDNATSTLTATEKVATTVAPTGTATVNGIQATTPEVTEAAAGDIPPLSGTWNVQSTENTQGAVAGAGQLASTTFELTEDIVADGNVLTIGESKYVFKVGKDSTVTAKDGETLIDLSDYEAGSKGLIDRAGTLLDNESANNSAFTIGYANDGKISIHEKAGQTAYTKGELETLEGFDALVYMDAPVGAEKGKSLTLQVGDTADDFQKVSLNIKDMSVKGLKLEGLSIANQTDAADAIKKIKDAINTVSSQRGDLGAIQNRLEHTINNLGVQAENITAAESRIRDTDMAEEMMAYTKNNILVQAAQAMLAQANQVPQGILQLLQ